MQTMYKDKTTSAKYNQQINKQANKLACMNFCQLTDKVSRCQ